MKQQRSLFAAVGFLFLSPLVHADIVTLINPGVDNRIATITGVNITGTSNNGLFDFTFVHQMTYDQVQALLNPTSPITWTSYADTETVLNALEPAIQGIGVVTGVRTEEVFVPYSESGPNVSIGFGNGSSAQNYPNYFPLIIDSSRTQNDILDAAQAWLIATPVPEPSAFLYLGIVVGGVLGMRRFYAQFS